MKIITDARKALWLNEALQVYGSICTFTSKVIVDLNSSMLLLF